MSVTCLAAGDDGTWRLLVDGHDHGGFESPDVFTAIAQSPGLSEIRPGVITEIAALGWSDDDLYRLADCLVVTDPDQDPEADVWDAATYAEHTDALEMENAIAPVLDRILYVNGERWAAALLDVSILRYDGGSPVFSPPLADGGERNAAVVRLFPPPSSQDDWRPPAMLSQWAELAVDHLGYLVSRIGLATPTLVVKDSDGDPATITWTRLTEPVRHLMEAADEATAYGDNIAWLWLEALAASDGRAECSVSYGDPEAVEVLEDSVNYIVTFTVEPATRADWLAQWRSAQA